MDVFIGALEENTVTNKHLVASDSYYHDRLTWCVQKRQKIPLWKNIFHLCNDPLVYFIATVVNLMVIAFAYVLQQFERHPKWSWNALVFGGTCCHLGFPCTYKPENNANRVLFLTFLFACQIFGIVLNTGLILFSSKPILNPQIEAIDEIIAGNFKLLGDRYAFSKMREQSEVNSIRNYFILYV